MAGKALDGAAGEREQFGRSSGNPVAEDFLVMSAQYYRAFAGAFRGNRSLACCCADSA
jgi:hypothetical protein